MEKNEKTLKRAGNLLRNNFFSKKVKSIAASTLAQRPDKKKRNDVRS